VRASWAVIVALTPVQAGISDTEEPRHESHHGTSKPTDRVCRGPHGRADERKVAMRLRLEDLRLAGVTQGQQDRSGVPLASGATAPFAGLLAALLEWLDQTLQCAQFLARPGTWSGPRTWTGLKGEPGELLLHGEEFVAAS
jgi:hypothetical protein